MENIHTFTGTFPRGFRGNIAYQIQLPEQLTKLSVTLTYNKERIENEKHYTEAYEKELRPVLEAPYTDSSG